MGQRSRLKIVRRKAAAMVAAAQTPHDRAAMLEQLHAHDIISAKAARRIWQLFNLKDPRSEAPQERSPEATSR